nr:hypothetical protein BaRGS_021088 [Batillaria attramentaria]
MTGVRRDMMTEAEKMIETIMMTGESISLNHIKRESMIVVTEAGDGAVLIVLGALIHRGGSEEGDGLVGEMSPLETATGVGVEEVMASLRDTMTESVTGVASTDLNTSSAATAENAGGAGAQGDTVPLEEDAAGSASAAAAVVAGVTAEEEVTVEEEVTAGGGEVSAEAEVAVEGVGATPGAEVTVGAGASAEGEEA